MGYHLYIVSALASLVLVLGQVPEIHRFSEREVEASEGDPVKLTCYFRAPSPVPQWSFNGTALQEGFHEGIFINSSTRKTTLTILSAEESHTGIYQCKVTNNEGSAVEEATVTVIGETLLPVLCPRQFDSYCFNGGTCYYLPESANVNDSIFCQCTESYDGTRCQHAAVDFDSIFSVRSEDKMSISVGGIISVAVAVATMVGLGVCFGYYVRSRHFFATDRVSRMERGPNSRISSNESSSTAVNSNTEMVTMLSSREDTPNDADNNNVKELLRKQTT